MGDMAKPSPIRLSRQTLTACEEILTQVEGTALTLPNQQQKEIHTRLTYARSLVAGLWREAEARHI
jgi:hypothetical protein